MRFKKRHEAVTIDIEGAEIENAPEPEDVVWQNVGVSKK